MAKVRSKVRSRPLATLTIHGAGDLIGKYQHRKRLYDWLCQQADDFARDWNRYARRYTARLER